MYQFASPLQGPSDRRERTSDSRLFPPDLSLAVMTTAEYLLRTTDAELVRLGLQHRLWSALANACWERAGFRPGQTLLDVGCGPGYTALDLAQLASTSGRVIAIDIAERFIAHLTRACDVLGITTVEALVQNVQAIDLPGESVDGAYARWTLCFVDDAEAVVQGVARVLRPGGRFAVQDYSNYRTLGQYLDIIQPVVERIEDVWRRRGGDPDVGKRVPAMMARAGLEVISVRALARVARPNDPLWQWPTTFFRNFVPVLVEDGDLSREEGDAFFREWERLSADPNSVFQTPPMLEVIGEKRC